MPRSTRKGGKRQTARRAYKGLRGAGQRASRKSSKIIGSSPKNILLGGLGYSLTRRLISPVTTRISPTYAQSLNMVAFGLGASYAGLGQKQFADVGIKLAIANTMDTQVLPRTPIAWLGGGPVNGTRRNGGN